MSVWCDTCRGSGYGGDSGHVYNTQEEYDGIREHVCRQCPVSCPACGGSGLDPDRLERAARAAQDVYLPSVSDVSLMFEKVAAAAITAYLRGEDDD